ncbi:MAG: hypothetical protein ACLRQF_04975 [Thomasclavelia ramosa]
MKETQTFEIKDMLVHDLSGVKNNECGLRWYLLSRQIQFYIDETTTYLDIGHQLEVLELLSKLNKEEQQTIVMVNDINHASRYSD